jgi:hypothetical protein
MKTQAPVTGQAEQKTHPAPRLERSIAQSGGAFDDARPQATALEGLQRMAANSPRTTQSRTMQAMAAASPRALRSQSVQAMTEARPNTTGLPDSLKAGIENLSGLSMDHVKVHYNSGRPAQLHAHAYAQGSDIHVAPGQERHLAHEAWHVVQQAQGRVRPTAQMKGDVPVNDDQGLEHEADVMGDKALASGSTAIQARTAGLARPDAGSAAPAQLKSIFKAVTPKKTGADTPLKTLHDNFGPLMAAAGLPSQYSFQTALPNIMHNDGRYAGSNWAKAGSVHAELDSASRSKADGSNRNNGVIGPYGHFGVMERALLGRPDRGNTYDGGHLVEHTLMEGQDADVHGNLAPQENKHFNQGLMRGWESIPERYMDGHSGKWNYQVEVAYIDDSYDRTGAELIAAGIIPKLAETNLAALGTPRDAELTGKTVTFERWVPLEWKATMTRAGGSDLPNLSLTHGAHMHNLMDTHTNARDEVFSTFPVAPLKRTNSGTLGGFFTDYGMVGGSSTTAMVGGTGVSSLSAHMYQPVPQPFAFQPFATSTPGGKVAVVIPPTSQTVNRLTADVSMSRLKTELDPVRVKRADGRTNLGTGTIIRNAKNASSEFLKLTHLFNHDRERSKFIRAVINCPTPLDKTVWPTVVASLSDYSRTRLESLILDPRLKP